MLTTIIFFLLLSILILIHEFGHFYIAKKSGMLVEEFGIGLPPRLFSKKIGETRYSLNLLPFGGFVKIYGDTPSDLKTSKSKDQKRAFSAKPWWQRGLVIVAGPIMNFLLAVVVISYMFTKGAFMPSDKVTVVEVQPNSPASKIKLQKDDVILSIANKPVKTSKDLISVAKAKAGTQVKIVYQRDSQELQAIVVPRKTPPKNQGALGAIISDLELKKYPFYQAPFVGLKESLRISVMFYKELGKIVGQLVTLQGPTVEVTGPIGIAKLTGQAVGYGFDAVIQLLGLLSLNLALINIIPFPALDGGQLSFVLFEAVSRRKISEDLKAKVNTIGFALLLGLLILITFKDIRGLF